MNLYLYIPPYSAHQPGIVRSLIFDQFQRYWLQNSCVTDYQHYASLLLTRLLERGHTFENVQPIFLQPADKIENMKTSLEYTQNLQQRPYKNKIYLHLEYYLDGTAPKNPPTLFPPLH